SIRSQGRRLRGRPERGDRVRWAEGQYDRLPDLAAELVRRQDRRVSLSGDSGGLDSVSPSFDVAPQQFCQVFGAPVLWRRHARSEVLHSLTDAVSSASDVAWLRRRTIGSGVPFGKKKAFQPSMATSVKPCSRAVARFGSLLARLGVRLAIAFTVFC